jgi:NitT/TauT family transport system permease protein
MTGQTWRDRGLGWGLPLLVLALSLLVWQLGVMLSGVHPAVLPGPWRVLQAAWEEGPTLLRGAGLTAAAAACGLLASIAVGSLVAVLFSQSHWMRVAFYPYVIFLQTVPIVAIAPLLITWMGYSFRSVVVVAMIISLFPIVSNVTAGLTSLDSNLRDLFRLYRASRWQLLWRLRIPGAVAHLVLGVRVSSGLAVIGAIVGEFLVGNATRYAGIGALITLWQGRMRTDALMAAVLASTLLGLVFFWTVDWISRRLLRRWTLVTGFESS